MVVPSEEHEPTDTTGEAAPSGESQPASNQLDIVTFNTHGAVDKSGKVQREVGEYLRGATPMIACFQELFYDSELEELDQQLLGSVVSTETFGKVEVAVGKGSAFRRRLVSTARGVAGAGGLSGVAIYSNLPISLTPRPRFCEFRGLPTPDCLSAKGAIAVGFDLGTIEVLVVSTHFCDCDNDRVDGRARSGNIHTIASVIEGQDSPIIVLGDFNIDSRARSGLDVGLMQELMQMDSRSWIELGHKNAEAQGMARPLPTLESGTQTLDHVLCTCDDPMALSLVSYEAINPFGSDHRLVRAVLRFS
jgi:endonuclease/exonuclease/phosphatase family metal-dependent hydrolase